MRKKTLKAAAPKSRGAGRRKLYPEIEPYRHGFLKVDGGHRLYWEECGNPAGKPAVFVHGGPGAGADARSRRFFDPKRYRIVVFDQRGCRSRARSGPGWRCLWRGNASPGSLGTASQKSSAGTAKLLPAWRK